MGQMCLSRGIRHRPKCSPLTYHGDLHHGHVRREAVFTFHEGGGRAVYNVFVHLGDGEFLFVASRKEFEQAAQLVQELKANWPNEYVVRDSEGNDVDPRDT
jgi:hypothetical protein